MLISNELSLLQCTNAQNRQTKIEAKISSLSDMKGQGQTIIGCDKNTNAGNGKTTKLEINRRNETKKGIGARARGAGGLQPPQILGNSDFLGNTRNLGKTSLHVSVYFFSKRYFLFQPEVGVFFFK